MKQQQATRLLTRACEGDAGDPGAAAAVAELLPLVYEQLHALAEAYFRHERDSHTLQPTALVHEAYVRLVDQTAIQFKSRNQFFVIAAKAMRNILVDHARSRSRRKRGGDWQEMALTAVEQTLGGEHAQAVDMERLQDALERLARMDERKAMLVELRFFAGLDEKHAAEVLGISRSTASEEWRMARAWLHRALKEGSS